MEERVDCRAGIYLACLGISELSFVPTQRGAVCAMFFEEVRVFESKHRQALRDGDGGSSGSIRYRLPGPKKY
jgi:hypothetical protein